MPLTSRSIEALKAKPPASRREIPDGDGLYFVVQPSGATSWAFRYRSPLNGKPTKFTIGAYPLVGLADARKAAAAAFRSVSEGHDPADEKKARRRTAADASNLVDAHLSSFLKRHVDVKLRPTTAGEIARIFDREIRPRWGSRKVDTITRRDVLELLDEITDRGAPTMANRVLAHLRTLFNWLVARDVLTASPVAGVKAPGEEASRDRVLTDEEIGWLWQATEAPGVFNSAIRLLLLTGQRRGEVEGITDAELTLAGDRPAWNIPAARAKNNSPHHVPLTQLAVETISRSPRIAGSRLVFSTSGVTPVSGWSKAKRAVDAVMLALARKDADDPEKITIPDWRLHDLRRTAASGMARLRQPVHVVEAVLNHRSGSVSGVAAVYNRYDYEDEKREALEAWASFVETLVEGRAPNVVALKAAR